MLDLPAYAGVSLEAGNTWLDREDVSFGDLRKDASLFFGVDTPLGPVYLATGFDEDGDKAFYLFLGQNVLNAAAEPDRMTAALSLS